MRSAGCWAVGVASLLAFAALTALVTTGWAPLVGWDARVHAALMSYGAAHAGWVGAWHVVTHLGDTVTLAVIDALLVGWCLLRRRWGLAALVAGVAVGAWAVRIGIRDLVDRHRPPDAFWPETLASYPSGHTTNATVTAGLAVLVAWSGLGRTGRVVAVAVALAYPVAVGFSRVAGGVHWPTDALGGLLLGAGIVATAGALWKRQVAR
jgi:membrane-associated phospholipid phosphatase